MTAAKKHAAVLTAIDSYIMQKHTEDKEIAKTNIWPTILDINPFSNEPRSEDLNSIIAVADANVADAKDYGDSTLEVDRYGFYIDDRYHHGSALNGDDERERKKKEMERTQKWTKMLQRWTFTVTMRRYLFISVLKQWLSS